MMNSDFELKIWITFPSAGSLHGGGLERCQVWFTKPAYMFIKTERDWEDQDLPFGNDNGQREGVQRWGWHVINSRGEHGSVSFGKTFGYESKLALHVWNKLCEFFGSEELREWTIIEREQNKTTDKFCLEVDLSGFIKL
ncbi:MAG: hypothetical protein AABY15_03010 [Nanoarchaeota archaeon]